MEKKYLTLNEAENLIPKLQSSIIKVQDLAKAISILDSIELEMTDHFDEIVNEIRMNKSFYKLNYSFFKELEELFKRGAIIKDIKGGIVDFYSIYDGREIFLCWKTGEKDIKYWHEVFTGFEARKPIALLRKKTDN